MLSVDHKYVNEIRLATEFAKRRDVNSSVPLQQLRDSLHRAMRLEASTIPPYLVAGWSIQKSEGFQNLEIRDLILGIAREEMLHMMAIMNIIAALGEPPKIATNDIVLCWGEDQLPVGGGVIPMLAPFSETLLTTLFMKIEEPADPVHYVVRENFLVAHQLDHGTIGEFYAALIELIRSFEVDPFLGGARYPQVRLDADPRIGLIGHAPIDDFEVNSSSQAIRLLEWIVGQGEGTPKNPLDGDGLPAHYYRFAEIYKKGRLVAANDDPLGYVYDRVSAPIICDYTKVSQFAPNPKMRDFTEGSVEWRGLKKFNNSYTTMFKNLQEFYSSGNTQFITDSVNSMNTMADVGNRLITGVHPAVCPSFEWLPV
ncbi:MAG: ferritin-like protein [Planctomycetaceae bacterium]|nr:ferritin-like protein [Planctomycetaceae bacterium]